ncbi:homeobox protein Meis3-like [Anopheles bellator]|uniref:homeobox protein Meis3-like n=1 Tax=Anopheles bellator TaxID=139047 RepID=UPI002647FA96|nr:homeobox protein Meis3-like [Anopheles bellator]
MQESSVTALPVSGVTASGLGTTGNVTTLNLTTNTTGSPNGTAIPTGAGGTAPGGVVAPNSVTTNSSSNSSSAGSAGSGATISTPHGLSDIDQAQFEADKRAVYKHPLFSLLALLLEKCEQATQGYIPSASSASSPNGSSNNGASDGDSFSRDIQAFVQLLEKEKRPLLTNNSELDGLMIKALQVLRIHLLELEKVQELCRDFCTRYIACLRSKMQSENLLRSDYALEHNNNLSNSNSPINSPEQDLSGSAQGYYPGGDYLQGSDTSDYSNMQAKGGLLGGHQQQQQQQQHHPQQQPQAVALLQQHAYHHHQMAAAPPEVALGLDQSPVAAVPEIGAKDVGGTLLGGPPMAPHSGLVGLGGSPAMALPSPSPLLDIYAGQLSPCGSSDELDSELDSPGGDDSSSGKCHKRGILPKQATSVMRAWLFQHLVHPYPTEEEKRVIAAQTNLTLLQVNNWFINARRRILLPMLENTSDNSGD